MAHGPIRLRLLATSALAGVTMLAIASPVLGNPIGGSVSAGQATISSLGQTVTIQQSSSKAVLNWASFNIAPGELTQFQQPSSSAIALNRINDVNPSTIQGSLTANGGVILINPNGVVFGSGAQVNVASLIATTANISDSAFMNSTTPVFNQPGNPNAQIVNQGTITAAQAGLVGLVAPNVENSGIITAKLGKVQLASGDSFTLDLVGNGVTQIGVSDAVLHQLVNNGGAIVADGGTVQITAAAARNALDSLIVNTGVIEANSIRQHGGTIILSADTPGNVITNSGTITAQGRGQHQPGGRVPRSLGVGGSVRHAASTIQQNGSINVSGASGGQVSMQASTITQDGTIHADGLNGPGGTITIGFTGSYADTATTLLTAASNTAAGGTIIIEGGLSAEASAKGDDNATLTASGAYIADGGTTGGTIDMLAGSQVNLFGAYLSALAPLGGGTISVGGDYVGTAGTQQANITQVDGNTLILADATDNGAGGQITISGTNILFAGQASAQGGPNGGNGGSITLFAPGSNAMAGNIAADKTGQSSSNVLDYGLLDAAGYGSGGTGGNVSVLGDNVGIMSGAFIDASGDAGGGYVRIGGDFHGEGTTPTALNTYVDPNAWIFANAVTSGNGGSVAVWSDGSTFFSGNIVAEGGANSGNGGFVETSGHGTLTAQGYVDLMALHGTKGTYLLDPATIEIYGNVTPAFNATDGSISLSSALQLWLDASNQSSITLSYNDLSTTATGSMGSNTITVGSNTGLVVGERIQLGGSSDTYAASINDNSSDGVYTITNISGTIITLDANLAAPASGAEIFGGYVKQMNDLSGQGNIATQTTAADMPLWISNGQNGLGTLVYSGPQTLQNTIFNPGSTLSTFVTFESTAIATNGTDNQRLLFLPNEVDIGACSCASAGYWSIVHDAVAWGTDSSVAAGDSVYHIFSLINNNGSSTLYNNGGTTAISTNNSGTTSFTGYGIGGQNYVGYICGIRPTGRRELGDRPVPRTTAMPDPAQDIPTNRPLGQRDRNLRFRTPGLGVSCTGRIGTVVESAHQLHRPFQRMDA